MSRLKSFLWTNQNKTPDVGLLSKRKDEVKAWLAEYKSDIESFVILDDYRFGWDDLSDFYIHTNPNYGLGLEEEQVVKAVTLLNSWTNKASRDHTPFSQGMRTIIFYRQTHKLFNRFSTQGQMIVPHKTVAYWGAVE